MVLASTLAGCEATPSPSGPGQVGAGPHNGVVVPLGKAGFAEILNETKAEKSKPVRKGRPATAVVVYFLRADKKSPLSPAPIQASVKLEKGDASETLQLVTAPAPNDAAGASRFASLAGDYDLSGLQGELTAKLGDETIIQAFQGPR
jgi:hypothetical protein